MEKLENISKDLYTLSRTKAMKSTFYINVLTYLLFVLSITWLVFPVSLLYRSIAGRYRPVAVADGPITGRYRFIKNASWVNTSLKIRLYT